MSDGPAIPDALHGDVPRTDRAAVGSPGRIQRLALKELRETLRDRRTIITLLLMPVLVYPLLSVVFQRFLLAQRPADGQIVYHLGVTSDAQWNTLFELLNVGERELTRDGPRETPSKPGADGEPIGEAAREKPNLSHSVEASLPEAVARNDVDLGVRLVVGEEQRAGRRSVRTVDVELLVQRSSSHGRDAAAFIFERLLAARSAILELRLRESGVTGRISPIGITQTSVKPVDGTTAFSLASVVPLILVLMTITGAVYPAIDLTAGERERGTLEALIAAPVPRMGLLVAKYIAVVTVAMLTATMNLLAMSVTILSVGLGPTLFGHDGLTPLLIAQVFALLMLFSAFFSAVLLAITSFARSFKEAQAYLIPVMLLAMAPGLVSVLPGVKLDAGLAVTPLLNIVLLARDLCEQQTADPVLIVVIVLSTALFAAGALAVAARIFGADAILYGSQGSWSDLWRGDDGDAPTLASALLVLALLFPAYFLSSHALAQVGVTGAETRLALSGGLTALLFAGLPLLVARIRRLRPTIALKLRRPSVLSLLGAAVLGCCLWTVAFEAVVVAGQLGVGPLDAATAERVKELIAQWKVLSPVWVVLALAVVPGVCEELFFRGFLLSALRTRMNAGPAILVSAALFGAFHLITTDSLTVVRFVPSTLLGAALGWICVRTGSVIPGMLLHATHNGLLLLVALYEDELKGAGWGVTEATHLPLTWLAPAGVAAAVGFGLVYAARKPPT